MAILPAVGRIIVAAILRSVDFPAPSEPTRPKIVPAGTPMLTSRTASAAPNLQKTPSIRKKGSSGEDGFPSPMSPGETAAEELSQPRIGGHP